MPVVPGIMSEMNMLKFGDGRDWFFEKRFGLFIHWGIYAVRAWHEQEVYRRMLPRARYAAAMKLFNPAGFDPEAWLDTAQSAGMEYVCFTAKHIDGFCMWDTVLTDFKVTRTPYGKDVLALLAEACRRRAMPLCLYYAVPDMHCPHYPHTNHPYEYPAPQDDDQPDLRKYLDYVERQVTELCSNYGRLAGFWWDANASSLNYHGAGFNEKIRRMQPGIIINNRGFDAGDFQTPERESSGMEAAAGAVYEKPIEACESIGRESWGYRANEDYFTVEYLTGNLCKHLAKGGNYLLNAGPRADGTFPPEAVEILARIGDWLRRAGREALWQTRALPVFQSEPAMLLTAGNNALYLNFYKGVKTSGFSLYGVGRLPRRASLLNTGLKLKTELEFMPTLYRKRHKLALHVAGIPADALPREAVIVKLEFDDVRAAIDEYLFAGGL